MTAAALFARPCRWWWLAGAALAAAVGVDDDRLAHAHDNLAGVVACALVAALQDAWRRRRPKAAIAAGRA